MVDAERPPDRTVRHAELFQVIGPIGNLLVEGDRATIQEVDLER